MLRRLDGFSVEASLTIASGIRSSRTHRTASRRMFSSTVEITRECIRSFGMPQTQLTTRERSYRVRYVPAEYRVTRFVQRCAIRCLLLAALPLAAAEKPEKWIEVRSPNFTIVSNASEKQARRAAEEFEQIRAVFQTAL